MEAGDRSQADHPTAAAILGREPWSAGAAGSCARGLVICACYRTLREGRMKFALVNPNWEFKGSTYFGCTEPHVPLELLYACDHLSTACHDTLLLDAQTDNLTLREVRGCVQAFAP